MKFLSVFLLPLAASANILRRGECHGNNCNRAVTGTRPGLLPFASRSADCRSFLLTTVTPAPTTVTVTVDDVGQPIPTDHVNKRADSAVTVTATNIPSYADNCVDAAEYRVACSCFGLTASVTTAPAPTVTVTTTVDSCEVL
ncbi:hypothetical protein QBC42DRAFT_338312 [Cladorrhinum samala]|uniref:Uncharacterized protein n=1 Tax=Cladorrhinum samala TaxID=585594 RepID=A0AAV9HQ52_9PEZI|nr:hypothetical protein QBC42DRAFT_338312 [Cladorrhinum samala]